MLFSQLGNSNTITCELQVININRFASKFTTINSYQINNRCDIMEAAYIQWVVAFVKRL